MKIRPDHRRPQKRGQRQPRANAIANPQSPETAAHSPAVFCRGQIMGIADAISLVIQEPAATRKD